MTKNKERANLNQVSTAEFLYNGKTKDVINTY